MNLPVPKLFTVVARIKAKPGNEAAVATELHKLVEPSRRDRGCVNYDMHVSLDDPGLYLFHENWETKADWEAHMQTSHLEAWRSVSDGLLAEFELMTLEKVE